MHRDVSPQNVLVGADGVPRVLDFGVAKAIGGVHTTRDGHVRGKLAYMAPEHLRGGSVDRRSDVFAASIVLWEALTLRRLFTADSEGATMTRLFELAIPAPSTIVAGLPAGLDAVVLRGLERDRSKRFDTARQMALALEASVSIASPTKVADWVGELAGEVLAQRAKSVLMIESESGSASPPAPPAAAETKAFSTEPSQVSSISVSSSGNHRWVEPRSRRRWGYVAVGVGATAVSVAAFGVSHAPSKTPAALATEVASTAPSSAVVPPSVASGDPPVAHTASTDPVPSAAVSSRHVTPRAPVPASPPTAKPCSIKSYIDDDGIKHFVKECK